MMASIREVVFSPLISPSTPVVVVVMFLSLPSAFWFCWCSTGLLEFNWPKTPGGDR
jgi:hypothetical protein